MEPLFLVVSDDQHKAYFNANMVCSFRLKKDDKGEIAAPLNVEIEFIGGTKTRLVGDTAKQFVSAIGKLARG